MRCEHKITNWEGEVCSCDAKKEDRVRPECDKCRMRNVEQNVPTVFLLP